MTERFPRRHARFATSGLELLLREKRTWSEIGEQIRSRLPRIRERFNATHFLAYFQSYTNTYADVEYLGNLRSGDQPSRESRVFAWDKARCLPDAADRLLEEIATRAYVSLELGIQSFEDETLQWLNRGHDRQTRSMPYVAFAKGPPRAHLARTSSLALRPIPLDAAREAAKLLE